jgi:ComF family protein
MRLNRVLRLYRLTLDLLLPPLCVVCGRVNTWLCPACAAAIPLARHTVCPRCGDGWSGTGVCERCRVAPLALSTIRSAFVFHGTIRDAIHALKYRGGRSVAEPLAYRMADAWQAHSLVADVLIPVPLYLDREAERGYNQATLLARALAPLVGVPMEAGLVFRIRSTRSQARLGIAERWANVQGAFACPSTVDLARVRVMLIDDVATTGATLDACAVALLSRGARSVSAFTLARAA